MVVLFLAAAALLPAQSYPPAQPRAEKIQSLDFPSGGLLRFKNSTGALTIEAWDKPTVELTTSYAASAPVTVSAVRDGNELIVSTTMPRHARNVDLSYSLRVPRDARIAIDHRKGEINVEGIAADVEANLRHGEIFVYLPEDAKFTTTAKSTVGAVILPDGPALTPRVFHLGHAISQADAAPAHKLNLKVGYGDIYVLRPYSQKPTAATP